jgi:hypothetical protein
MAPCLQQQQQQQQRRQSTSSEKSGGCASRTGTGEATDATGSAYDPVVFYPRPALPVING